MESQVQAEQKNKEEPVAPNQEAYVTGPGSYNRESGRKTLMFVGGIIAIITILSVLSLLMITRKSSVMVQSNSVEKPQSFTSQSTKSTSSVTSPEEKELDSIKINNPDEELQTLRQEADQL